MYGVKVESKLGFTSPTVSSTILAADVFVKWIREKKTLEEWGLYFNQVKQLTQVKVVAVSTSNLSKLDRDKRVTKSTSTPGKVTRRNSRKLNEEPLEEYSFLVGTKLTAWVTPKEAIDNIMRVVAGMDNFCNVCVQQW